jgi:hypothetical protein
MRCAAKGLTLLLLALLAQAGLTADKPAERTPREALKPFNDLIGSWKAIGTPEGKLPEKQKGLWEETISWEWQFKDNDAWLKATFDKGKYFTECTLRYLPDKEQYQLSLTTTDEQKLTFTGPLKEHRLTVERQDEKTKDTQRLVFSLVGDNRYLYNYEVQPANQTRSRKVYQVGATKDGAPLVKSSDEIGPFCVVSYGPPNTAVMYNGKTYYVCCASCRQEFKADPEKYIKEYEEMLAKMAKERAEKARKP